VEFSGSVPVAAPRDRVWAFVDDIEQVAGCGPGVESVEVRDDGTILARAKVVIGPISFRFAIDGAFIERVEGERSALRGHARAPGTEVDGTTRMELSDADDGTTIMNWSAEVRFSGKIATLGARLVQGTANRMIGQIFTCIKAKLETPG
jgi:carbon monoxide dehydrogenase subunit G